MFWFLSSKSANCAGLPLRPATPTRLGRGPAWACSSKIGEQVFDYLTGFAAGIKLFRAAAFPRPSAVVITNGFRQFQRGFFHAFRMQHATGRDRLAAHFTVRHIAQAPSTFSRAYTVFLRAGSTDVAGCLADSLFQGNSGMLSPRVSFHS